MALSPLLQRRDDLVDALEKVSISDEEELRRAVDKIALARAVREEADRRLEPIGGPYTRASIAVRNAGTTFASKLKTAEQAVQRKIDGFRSRQRQAAARAKDEQRQREAALRADAGLPPDPVAAEPVKASDVRLESVRSDYRGQVFDRKVLIVRIVDPRLLPDTILKAPAVTEALEKAVRKLAALTRDIPGAEIEDDQASSVKVG